MRPHRITRMAAHGLLRGALSLLAICTLTHDTFADVPHLIRYQGQAVDQKGVPLEGTNFTLHFRLYDADTGGTVVWEEQHTSVPITKGHFAVLLGQATPLADVDWSQPLWLGLQIGTDPELSPRQRITSVPLAIRAETAEVVKTSGVTDDANRLVPSGAIILWGEGSNCPAGYTRVSSYDDKFLVGSSTAGTNGGNPTHNHGGGTGLHTLTIGEIPSHVHLLPTDSCGPGDMASITGSDNADESFNPSCATGTAATGGGGGHGHPISNDEWRPPFKTVLLCKKD